MSSLVGFLSHGLRALGIMYVTFWLAFVAGLYSERAPLGKYFSSPFKAAVAFLIPFVFWLVVVNLFFAGLDEHLWGVALIYILNMLFAFLSGGVEATWNPSESFAHRRGAIVRRTFRRRSRHPDSVTIGGITIGLDDETKHIKIVGTTGTGKSTAIREILTAALARGDRAIIADPDGGYLARFYDPGRGDVILNPFDGDAHKWNLFGEIINSYDVEQLAYSLITDGGASDRTWTEYARTLFCAVTKQCIIAGIRDDKELFRLLTKATADELRTLLAGTSAGPFLEPGNEKMFGSVRAILSSAIRALEYTVCQQGDPLSVRTWVKEGASRSDGGKGGVLFIPYKAGEIAALRSVISAWLRIGIFEAMDSREGDQRIWFVVDELDALGEIDSLKDALARLRKFGGRCILGFQSIAQVSGTYGRGAAEAIVENCGNTLILRCSASERGGTSEFVSKLIGMREVVHTTSSKTHAPGKWMASTTKSENLRIEPAVMASEIERLPNLRGFLKVVSEADWQVVDLTPLSGPAPVRERKARPPESTPPMAVSPAKAFPTPVRPLVSKPRRVRSTKGSAGRGSAALRDSPSESIMPSSPTTTAFQSPPGEAE